MFDEPTSAKNTPIFNVALFPSLILVAVCIQQKLNILSNVFV